jgi:thiol-disulfide isomerase/thioredoxin
LVIFARSADKQLAGIARSEAEEPDAKVVIGPVATATGTLKDLEGKPVADRELTYGIRIYQGEPVRSPFMDSFGGATKTDTQGRFSLVGLVPAEAYQLNVKIDEHSSRTVTEVVAKNAQPLDLGELSADPNPTKPYVPPTPAERAAQGFAAKRDMPLADRLDNLLAEARREYTQPLLLFGQTADPACIELYRLFEESDTLSEEEKAKGDFVSPDELRWEFELAALDVDRSEVREQAAKLKIELAAGVPVLAVLNQKGALVETLPLRMKEKKLDSRAIGGWMAKHKLPTRDAQQMLDEALAKAQAEDKRVFFILSASWCGPCRMLARFLAPHKSELEKHFVFVKLDVSRDEHAGELRERFKESASGGVPWYCILNAEDAKVLCTSNVPEANPSSGNSNMGFPTLPNEVEHFVGMLKSTAPRLTEEKLAEYTAELLKKK